MRVRKLTTLRVLSFFSVVSLVLICTLTIAPIYKSTEYVEATTGTSTASSLDFVSTNPVASVSMSVSSPTGTFATSSNNEKAAFSISTNNYTGYTIALKSISTNTNLVNDNGNSTYNISSIPNSTSKDTFSSNGDSGQALNNRWGYIPNYYNATDNNVENTNTYYPSPTSSVAAILNTTTAANGSVTHSAITDDYTIGLGMRADFNSPSGTYTNETLVVEYIANPISYSISFTDDSGDNTVSNLPGAIAGSASETEVALPTTIPTRTGHTFISWCLGTITITDGISTCEGSAFPASTTGTGGEISYFGIDQTANNTNIELTAMWETNTYNITLNNNSATNSPTATTTVQYSATSLGTLTTLPQRVYTVSGLSANGVGSSGATITFNTNSGSVCTAANNCKYTYVFNGWYKEAGATNKIAGNTATPALQANTSYTNSNSQWTSTSNQTLYAGWGAGTAITLPTITLPGHVCGWATANNTTTRTYTSGQTNVVLTSNISLYGTCEASQYTLTLNQNNATTNGTASVKATYGSSSLSSTITNPSRQYTISFNANGTDCSVGSSSLPYTYTFNGWNSTSNSNTANAVINTSGALVASAPNNAATYTNASGQWIYTGNRTLYAGWTRQSFTMPASTRTGYTCAWNTAEDGTGTSYTQNAATSSYGPTANSTLYAKATPNQYTITLNQNNATTNGTTSVKVTYDSSTLSTNITKPQRTYTISGFTLPASNNASGATVTYSTAAATSTGTICNSATNCKYYYGFNGWYTTSTGGSLIIDNSTNGALQASVSGWTNADAEWVYAGGKSAYARWANSSLPLPTITKTGYLCGWTTTATNATSITYASGATTFHPTAATTLYGVCTPQQYTITLNSNGATTGGSNTTKATYDATTLGAITNPSRSYTISGFTNTTSGTNSTISATTTLTSNYTFNGWYKESGATNKIASNATTPVLQASTSYTDADGKWTSTSNQTLYAGWTGQAKTLPTITRTGSTCGWATSSTATTWNYASGASITPTSNLTLYGVCRNNITLNNSGATTSGSTSATVNYNATSLSAITVPQRKYTVSGFTRTTSGTNSTISSTTTLTNTATFKGWYTASSGGTLIASSAATPALQASTTYTNTSKQWTYTTAGTITLYAQWTDNAVTLPTITRTGSTCGWATSSTATTWNYASGASITPTSNLTLYGVCRNNITLNQNGATTNGSTSATVNYNATSLSAITVPQRKYTVSGFTRTTSGTNSTISSTTTLTNTATFKGWYTASSGGTLIASSAATPALQASTTYTNASKQWTYTTAGTITLYAQWTDNAVTLPTITRTGSTCGWATSSTATTWNYASGASITPTSNLTLYGVCRNNITLNQNGATTNGSTSATVNYNATSLSAITVPQRKYTVSGFTKTTSGANSTVSATTTLTSTYTFNGWYTASSGGTLIASNAATPALQASTTYTNASKQWTYTTAGAITLYAQWTSKAVTLPTITRTGSTCGWATSSTATTWTYNSGASITPTSNLTLYGVCRNNITLNQNGATTNGSTSATVNYGATSLSAITVPQKKFTVSGFTKTTSGANSTVSSTTSLTSTSTFKGWYTASSGGTLIASSAATPALQASTTYTNASKQWTYTTAGAITLYAQWTDQAVTLPTITRTGSTCGWATSSTATTWNYNSGASITPTSNLTLYGVCRNNITLNRNGGTTGSTSATVNYGSTTINSITVPTRVYTISGFTLPSSNNANSATVTYSTNAATATGSVCTTSSNCKYGYALKGWYTASSGGTLIASKAASPALQASTTYTDADKKWTYTTASTVTLYAQWNNSDMTLPTITKNGYTCGWTTTATNATSITYASGATNFRPTANTTLYGVCTKNYMQNLTLANCSTTAMTVYDNRDETAYTVQKLSDGNCWLLDNLALDLTNQTVVNALTNSNTNASTTTLNYLKNGGGTSSNKYAITGLSLSNWTSGSSFSAPLVNTSYKNTTNSGDSLSGATSWKYGMYYNYCAASAGSYCWGNGSSSGSPSGNATEDICPKGWHLPTGTSTGDYYTLYGTYYTTATKLRNALHLPLAGGADGNGVSGRGSAGGWWTSSKFNNNTGMDTLYIYNSGANVNGSPMGAGRDLGYSIRCIKSS